MVPWDQIWSPDAAADADAAAAVWELRSNSSARFQTWGTCQILSMWCIKGICMVGSLWTGDVTNIMEERNGGDQEVSIIPYNTTSQIGSHEYSPPNWLSTRRIDPELLDRTGALSQDSELFDNAAGLSRGYLTGIEYISLWRWCFHTRQRVFGDPKLNYDRMHVDCITERYVIPTVHVQYARCLWSQVKPRT